jgi:hypothetical protein
MGICTLDLGNRTKQMALAPLSTVRGVPTTVNGWTTCNTALVEKSGIEGKYVSLGITLTGRKMERAASIGRTGPIMKVNFWKASSVEKAYNSLQLSKKPIRVSLKVILLKVMAGLQLEMALFTKVILEMVVKKALVLWFGQMEENMLVLGITTSVTASVCSLNPA